MEVKEAPTMSHMDLEDGMSTKSSGKRGGWITVPSSLVRSAGALGLATSGASANLLVYLVEEFNVKSIDAAQITNIVNGCVSLAPILGAVISDSFFGCFPVIAVSTAISLLSMVLFTLTSTISSLRPAPCATGSDACPTATPDQLAVLYAAVALVCVASGGTRFTTATMGADQFDSATDQNVFFNWYFIAQYVSSVLGATVIVYVQDSVSWGWGFGISAAASAAATAVLLLGLRHYRRPKPTGSPFTGLARVAVAAVRKWRLPTSPEAVGLFFGPDKSTLQSNQPPSLSLRWLNKAAVVTRGDNNEDGSLAKPWRLCTVQEVEDLKAIVRILPLWLTGIFLSISIGIQGSLTVLQALTVDRRLGPTSPSPPAPSSSPPSPPPRKRCSAAWDWPRHQHRRHGCVGVGGEDADERREEPPPRRRPCRRHRADVGPLAAAAAGARRVAEALHFPGQVAFYYQEFPPALRGTATGMMAVIIALGFYLSTAVIDLVRRATDWLPDNVNASRLDRVYWTLAAGGAVNLGMFLILAQAYRCRSGSPETLAAEKQVALAPPPPTSEGHKRL
ncbi:unnamed protein product [Spirodela intermedia]|uniref:Uncharacterized protein n=1 Tax=Spirodela intermedia TaxID=51605 RepID=A0A7I8JGK3_SPIIN|nr:unnamed protein product [Spirodela intermedia]CAA6669277.1 unnamed protein product [Spirodela intermedia]